MLSRIINCEYDYDFGIKPSYFLRRKISASIEPNAIGSRSDLKARRKQILCPAIDICASFAN